MSDLDTQIRSVIGELLDAAPVPPPFPDRPGRQVPRRGGRRWRAPLIVGIIVASCVAIGVITASLATRHATRVAIEPSKHLTVADVTFAIFDRPVTPADALPTSTLQDLNGDGVWIDPVVGSRLAIRSSHHDVYLAKACASRPTGSGGSCPAPAVRYCIQVLDYVNRVQAGGGGGCTTPKAILKLGGDWQTGWGTDDPVSTVGFVPDFVTRVSYEGQSVPIVNNVFVMDGVRLTQPLIITRSKG